MRPLSASGGDRSSSDFRPGPARRAGGERPCCPTSDLRPDQRTRCQSSNFAAGHQAAVRCARPETPAERIAVKTTASIAATATAVALAALHTSPVSASERMDGGAAAVRSWNAIAVTTVVTAATPVVRAAAAPRGRPARRATTPSRAPHRQPSTARRCSQRSRRRHTPCWSPSSRLSAPPRPGTADGAGRRDRQPGAGRRLASVGTAAGRQRSPSAPRRAQRPGQARAAAWAGRMGPDSAQPGGRLLLAR